MNIFISNLPLSVTQDSIRELFVPYGNVKSIRILEDKHTGLPNGTAYVQMLSQEEADQAIAKLEGTEYKGERLHVTQADAADFPTSDFW